MAEEMTQEAYDRYADIEEEREIMDLEDDSLAIADLKNQIASAKEQQAKKLEQSTAYLVQQCKSAAEKYGTVNGYMQCRSFVVECLFDGHTDLTVDEDWVDERALYLADKAKKYLEFLADEFDGAEVQYMEDVLESDTYIEGFSFGLDRSFVQDSLSLQAWAVRVIAADQMLVCSILQNIGPSVDDIVQFKHATDEEIAKLKAQLAEYEA